MVALPGMAAERPARVTGIFSDLHYNEEGGDLLGTEIFIVYAAHGYTAFVQCAEGSPGVAVAVPVKVNGNHVSFIVPEPSNGAGSYDGRISATGFIGTITGTTNGKSITNRIQLRRKKSYWE